MTRKPGNLPGVGIRPPSKERGEYDRAGKVPWSAHSYPDFGRGIFVGRWLRGRPGVPLTVAPAVNAVAAAAAERILACRSMAV